MTRIFTRLLPHRHHLPNLHLPPAAPLPRPRRLVLVQPPISVTSLTSPVAESHRAMNPTTPFRMTVVRPSLRS